MSRWIDHIGALGFRTRVVPLCFFAILLTFLSVGSSRAEGDSPVSRLPNSKRVENLIQIGDRFVSGGQPKVEEAFSELMQLGITTIVSVDGLVPNVELAKKFGMRYLHVPIGYSGIPDETVRLLAAIPQQFPGRIYIHCHHGKHRGPAAAAICGLSSRDLTPDTARDLLKLAGTSTDYPGLWNSVASFRSFSDAELAEVTFTSEVTKPSISQSMAELERAWESIDFETLEPSQLSQERTYETILQVAEHFTESARFAESTLSDPKQNSAPAAAGQSDEATSIKMLHEQLNDVSVRAKALLEAIRRNDLAESKKIARSIAADCKSCHKEHRNRQLDR